MENSDCENILVKVVIKDSMKTILFVLGYDATKNIGYAVMKTFLQLLYLQTPDSFMQCCGDS